MATQWKYLPILKWKQGERIALRHLTAPQWEALVPLIELPAIVATPDSAGLKSVLPGYLTKLAGELKKTFPEKSQLAVDVRYVAPVYPRQVQLLNVICSQLAKLAEREIIPVITQSMVIQQPQALGELKAFPEFVLRTITGFTQAETIAEMVKLLAKEGVKRSRLHLLIDQFSIVNEAPAARVAAIKPYLDVALTTGAASITLAGGSFPINLMGMGQGVKDLPRLEWQIWKALCRDAKYKTVRYSDYTVSNPAPVPDMDPKMVNPSVAIRYAADGFWRLFKAGGFKKGKPNQYKNLCLLLLGDTVYSGASFSFGDACYDKAANAKLGNGNPSSWRRDATSHHLVLTASAL
ncbi:MAG: hypothetical protein WCN21_03425 [Comamonadaceae bacterium]